MVTNSKYVVLWALTLSPRLGEGGGCCRLFGLRGVQGGLEGRSATQGYNHPGVDRIWVLYKE